MAMDNGFKSPSVGLSILRQTLLLFLPIALLCVGGAFAIYKTESNALLTKLKIADKAAVQVGVNSIKSTVELITKDLSFLTEQHGFKEIISRSPNPETHTSSIHSVLSDWLALSKISGKYDQIRWLDVSGQERLRVNFNNGKPQIVAGEKLQNKGKRYYFTDAVKLNKGEYFISPLDLNIEHGEIEKPLKPMIRIGTPIYDDSGKKKGIILLNYLGQHMLAEYTKMMGRHQDRAWLLNNEGYWLKGPSSQQEWGFMYKKPELSMPHDYNHTWKKIAPMSMGQFEDEHGLWTFKTLYPLQEGQKSSAGTHEAFKPSMTALETGEYFWKSVLLQPRANINEALWQTSLNLILATLVLLSIGLLGCWRMAHAWVNEREKELELEHLNASLEEMIEARTRELQKEVIERKRIAEELEERSERFRSITTTSSTAIIMTVDQTGQIITWNPAAERAFGYDEDEALGRSLTDFMPERFRKAHQKGITKFTRKNRIDESLQSRELVGLRRNGTEFPIEVSLGTWVQNEIRYFSAVMLDVTERKENEEQLRHLATHDTLTGLPTRRLCFDHLNRAMAFGRRNKVKAAALFMDLDGFKQVNDTLGHDVGDQLLIQAGNRLVECVREIDTVSRLGGDEFVIILSDVKKEQDVEVVAQKLINAMSQPFSLGDHEAVNIGASIGIALYPDHAQNSAQLIKCADEVMYDVKSTGKNNYAFCQGKTVKAV